MVRNTSCFGLLVMTAAVSLLALWWLPFTGEDRADHRNPEYVLWKWGLAPLPNEIVYGALGRDPGRSAVVEGKTVEELRAIFGDVRVRGLTAHQASYDRHMEGERAWLADTWWCVRFIDGRAVSLDLLKG